MNFYRWAVLVGALVCVCDGVHVSVREKQRFAMLFQSVVLPCQYQTASTQTPVVQWWYKSYCRDRTRESFTLPESLGVQASDLGATSHLECSDSSRTVHVVASAQGASMTLAEHYKGRDIAIINKADLRIGQLQWGDSGVYFCKVVVADDLEGKNEAQLELLVLEWAFVGSVVLGSILFMLLLGICWCQCCPHSCCCYVRCCCCPDTCCCPRHLYEAGKMAKSTQPAQMPVYPYYIPGVPAVVPLAPSSHVEPKIATIPSLENNLARVRSGYRLKPSQDQDSMKVLYYIEKELAQFPSAKMAALKPSSLSELSSLHDGGNTVGGNNFRHTYQTVQMKALPSIPDLDDQSVLRVAPPTQSRRYRRDRGNHSDDELDRRWNPRSEHLQRKTLSRRGRTGSLDELEEFAQSYGSRSRRAEPPDRSYDRDYSPPRRFYRDEDDGWGRRSPSPLPQKRRDTWDSDRPPRLPQSRGYDDTFLNSVLQSKARGRGGAGRVDEDSDTPSKGSSRGKGSDSYYSRSPSNRPEEEDPLPPYSELEAERYRRADPNTDRYRTVEPPRTERYRTTEPTTRPFSYTRPHQGMSHTLQGGREERDRSRNLSTALSRDTLIV
ncbi:immunoglobulin-like domain-containing receptor 2 isoform X2 [Thunnus albacares]|uniref:immunoglobulin-like domain-containing receptor 2 isoform X2 n=1 Tax=Thunnus maccoyii TaxID=8240 RepID=UPI001C4D7639|nr:immunoglobulin-like domain-containing receptor 2 isoform X2 [Thunnus maccoyii]XP_044222377.1 immunoglobulin-like domain-containing receptor 2 isoform X2 [Thunnus albacares]